MNPLKMAPPWVVYMKEIEALFGEDKDIRIETSDKGNGPSVKLYVANARKAAAIAKLLPLERQFGSVVCNVTVVPGNGATGEFADSYEIVCAAFEGNPVMATIRPVSKGFFKNLVYAAFRKDVVQFFADNLADINGNRSTLFETIAAEVIPLDGVFYCTAGGEGLAAPLGEWP